MSGKKYFYSLGQRSRALGWKKDQAEVYYRLEATDHYARIAFDAGFRGLSL